jgi:hypothetical protein
MKFLILIAMIALGFLGLATSHIGGGLTLLVAAYICAMFAF